jgi:Co/Zn/Cd efflux system component
MHSHTLDGWKHDVFLGEAHERKERRTLLMVGRTGAMMVAEIAGGTFFGSMTLLTDGWHMSTRAGAGPSHVTVFPSSRAKPPKGRRSRGTSSCR